MEQPMTFELTMVHQSISATRGIPGGKEKGNNFEKSVKPHGSIFKYCELKMENIYFSHSGQKILLPFLFAIGTSC